MLYIASTSVLRTASLVMVMLLGGLRASADTTEKYPTANAITERNISNADVQCAHWCAFRVCQLLGENVAIGQVVEEIPPREGGASLLDLKLWFERRGFQVDGVSLPLSDLDSRKDMLPVIAQLSNPYHFIVIAESAERLLYTFDAKGDYGPASIRALKKRWTGKCLSVTRPSPRTSRYSRATERESAARIHFEEGLIRYFDNATNKDVEISFPFRNIGSEPLHIARVARTCSCIKSFYPEKSVPPGESGVIRLVFSAEGRRGPFSENVYVFSDDPLQPTIPLGIVGHFMAELRVLPDKVTLAYDDETGTLRGRAHLIYRGAGNLEITENQTTIEGLKITCGVGAISDVLTKTVHAKFRPHEPKGKPDQIVSCDFEVPAVLYSKKTSGTVTFMTNLQAFSELSVSVKVPPPGWLRIFPSTVFLRASDGVDKYDVEVEYEGLNSPQHWAVEPEAGLTAEIRIDEAKSKVVVQFLLDRMVAIKSGRETLTAAITASSREGHNLAQGTVYFFLP
jgi:hypothetical protein